MFGEHVFDTLVMNFMTTGVTAIALVSPVALSPSLGRPERRTCRVTPRERQHTAPVAGNALAQL